MIDIVGPGALGVEDGDVGGSAGSEAAAVVPVQDAGGADGEQLDHAGQRNAAGVDQLFEREAFAYRDMVLFKVAESPCSPYQVAARR